MNLNTIKFVGYTTIMILLGIALTIFLVKHDITIEIKDAKKIEKSINHNEKELQK